MLRRELYRGRIVWNKMRRVDRGGTRTKVRRPDSEWLTLDAPDLRIIDDALWQSAHAVLDGKAGAYIRLAGGKLIGRPEGTRESPFLLTGLARCGWCRGSMYSITRLAKGQAWTYYGCYYNRSRGAHVCRNSLSVPQAAANRLVLDALAADVLTPERVKRIVGQTLSAWRAQQVPAHARRQELERRREQLVVEIRKLEADLASGAPWSLLREPIESRRRERDSVQKQVETLDGLAHLTSRMTDEALWRDIARRLTDWQGLLERQPVQARQILRNSSTAGWCSPPR
jgi:site-specific DNA recombinase